VTPEQEALARTIAAVDFDGASPGYRIREAHRIAELFRVVGDDEVVIKRSSIREAWFGTRLRGWAINPHQVQDTDERVGLIRPWPPEASS
jgi:hypothetical protein